MADTKISNLSAITSLADGDELVVASSGASKKITGANVKASAVAYDAELAALAGLTSAADKVPYFTGSGAASLATLSSAGRALIDDSDAAAQRTTLGLGGLATLSAVGSSEITDGSIVNADVNASAAIAYSKLALATSIVIGDLAAALVTALTGGGAWTVVTKSGDEDVSSSTAVQNDNDLSFSATNGAVYEVEVFLVYLSAAGGGTPDLKLDLGESSADSPFMGTGLAVGNTLQNVGFVANASQTLTFGTATTVRGLRLYGVHVGRGGTFQLRWAQNTSDSNATTVKAGSLIRYRRIF